MCCVRFSIVAASADLFQKCTDAFTRSFAFEERPCARPEYDKPRCTVRLILETFLSLDTCSPQFTARGITVQQPLHSWAARVEISL